MLSGVQVRDDKTTVQTLLGSSPENNPAFSDQVTAFLTPLIVSALEKATADQRVGFKVIIHTALGPETTAAALYVHGQSLHLTILEYRNRQTRPDDIHMPNRRLPDPTGLNDRVVFFLPESARRPNTYQRTTLFGQPEDTTLVIDYGALAQEVPVRSEPVFQPVARGERRPHAEEERLDSSMTAARPAKAEPASPDPDEVHSLKDLVIKKDMELENLKLEIHSLRRQLAERDAQIDLLKRKSKALRPQTPTP